jgi:eukaryotic-like serine/threonine-protein kinase
MLPPGIPGPGGRVADKFVIEGVLARGGMGIVLSAQHETLQQRVAIKVLLPEVARDEVSAARFAREAKAIAQLQCDNVVRVMDVGRLPSGLPYMVMERLTGFDLGEQLRRSGPLSVADAVDVVLQSCVAVAEAHARGIVHRDLKPANLFRNHTPDGASMVKVLDFGISKSMFGANGDRNVVNTVSVWGSPLYMAPEQVLSKQVGPGTDIWSLGVILYELLTGVLPFQAESLVDVCDAIVSGEPLPLSSVRPELPAALCAIVARCIEKQPERRWPNAGAFAAALVPFAAPRAAEYARRALHLSGGAPVSGPSPALPPPMPAPPMPPALAALSMPPRELSGPSWATTQLVARRRNQQGSVARAVLAGFSVLVLVGSGVTTWSLLTHSRKRLEGPLLPTSQMPPPAPLAAPAGDGARPAQNDRHDASKAEPPAVAPAADAAPPGAAPSSPAPAATATGTGQRARPPAPRPAPPPAAAQSGELPIGGTGVMRDLARDRK